MNEKESHRLYMREWRKRNPDKARENRRRTNANHPDKRNLRLRRYRQRYPLAAKAHRAVSKAIMRGHMEKSPYCLLCLGTKQIEAHHQDYSKPLDVIWLCSVCHKGIEGKSTRVA